MKKAQTEIIGLMVIVIILVVLAFIFIRLGFKQEPSFMPEMRQSTTANNLLLAIIRTNTPWGKMTDLIEKSDNNAIKQEISTILSKSLSNNYQFSLEINKELTLKIGDCQEGVSATQSFPKNENIYRLTLKLC